MVEYNNSRVSIQAYVDNLRARAIKIELSAGISKFILRVCADADAVTVSGNA